MNYSKKVVKLSNYWYNDGLSRANMRDLSGAISSLRRSLQYCSRNVAARNLLGLVYYGRGEINEALVEWIISKNLKARDNIANYFIRKVQDNASQLEKMNTSIKKYNQCLAYCEQDAEDLALIQLKKITGEQPGYVKASQLMALLLIRGKHYARARQVLRKIYRIDMTDPVTLYYMNCLEEVGGKKRKRRSKEEVDENVTYQVGNESIIQPTEEGFKDHVNSLTILNIIIGIIIGSSIIFFLVMPNVQQDEAQMNANAIRDYSEQLEAQKAEINALKTELNTYREESDVAENAETALVDTKSSYEALYLAKEQYDSQGVGNVEMTETLLKVAVEQLGEEGLAQYNDLAADIFPPVSEDRYEAGQEKFESEDYEGAIEDLEYLMRMNPEYEQYEGMLLLADAYKELGNAESAEMYYNTIIENGVNFDAADAAQEQLASITE